MSYLPEGVQDFLAPHVRKKEALRRSLIDCLESWGYYLVQPASLEFVAYSHTSQDVFAQSFKVTDTESGRTLAIHADVTPQIVRLDAKSPGCFNRYAYCQTILKSRARSLESREYTQIGAEIICPQSYPKNSEILRLVCQLIKQLELGRVVLQVTCPHILEALVSSWQLGALQQDFYGSLKAKQKQELSQLLQQAGSLEHQQNLYKLLEIKGEPSKNLWAEWRKLVEKLDNQQALDELDGLKKLLEEVQDCAKNMAIELDLYVDAAELLGFSYETGMQFLLYHEQEKQPILSGGSYKVANKPQETSEQLEGVGFSANLDMLTKLVSEL